MQLRSLAVIGLILAMAPPYIHSQETSNSSSTAPQTSIIHVDAKSEGTPFPHFWEQIFGSGRAILTLRESYRDDLRTVKKATGLQAIRFHGIFQDEVGFFDLDANGQSSLQLLLHRPDLRWPASQWRAPLRRAEFHAQETRL